MIRIYIYIQLLRKSRHRAWIEEPTKQETNQPSNQETIKISTIRLRKSSPFENHAMALYKWWGLYTHYGSSTLPKFRAPRKHEIQG